MRGFGVENNAIVELEDEDEIGVLEKTSDATKQKRFKSELWKCLIIISRPRRGLSGESRRVTPKKRTIP
eukprot:744501-Hanusia_phi.AAC.1